MASFYFSQSTGSNTTGNGSIGNPWQSFYPMKSGANALSPGDICYFKAGDTWEQQEMIVDSDGSLVNGRIVCDRYGSGANPKFRWAVAQGGWTYSGANEIYYKTGLFAWPSTVGVDETSALGVWATSNTTLPRGSFFTNGAGTVYIRLADGSNPSGHTIYVPGNYQSDGARGIVRGSNSRGKFLDINNIDVLYANGKGFSLSQPDSNLNDCTAIGCGADGFLFNGYLPNNEMANYCRAYRCLAEYNCAGANFYSGMGQAYTTGASFTWWIDCVARLNFMAGFDWLDYDSAQTNVQYSGAIRCIGDRNGQALVNPSYDPNFYVDGARHILLWGCQSYGGGRGPGTAGNARGGITFGSEHPTTKPCHHIYVINCLMNGTFWNAMSSGNTVATDNITDIFIINCTIIAYRSGFSMVYSPGNVDLTIPNGWHMKNNIIYAASGSPASNWMPDGSWQDSDYNLYYRAGGNTTIYRKSDGTNFTLAQWQTQISDEAHSIYGDPKFIVDTEDLFNVRLQRTALGEAFTSPAVGAGLVNPYTPPTWIADALVLANNGAVAGSTRSDGVATAPAATMDIGYHYPSTTSIGTLTSTNVEPATLYHSTVNSIAISFTTVSAIPIGGRIVITFPTSLAGGFAFNSGATSAASFTSGGSGSLAVGIAGAVVTLTRSGGSSIAGSQAVVISLTFVLNPTAIGSTGAYQIQTQDASGLVIDQDLAVSADTVIAPASSYSPLGFEKLIIENLGLNN